MLPQSFYENISDFIFMEDVPKKADIILIPGGSYPSLPEKAAQLWRWASAVGAAIRTV